MHPATTPEPPYTAVIFSALRGADESGYAETAERMATLAAEQPGYLGLESTRDGDRSITVSYWRDAAAARDWKAVAEHLTAQRLGRERWYRGYTVRIATVQRAYHYE